MASKRLNYQLGGIPFLGILILIALGILAVGSYFQYQDQKAQAPSPTPTPYVVSVDKSNPKEGEILVVFSTNTPVEKIAQTFANAKISSYEQIQVASFLIYKAQVGAGVEEEAVAELKADPNVLNATLSYE
jgi:hypothetical protein